MNELNRQIKLGWERGHAYGFWKGIAVGGIFHLLMLLGFLGFILLRR